MMSRLNKSRTARALCALAATTALTGLMASAARADDTPVQIGISASLSTIPGAAIANAAKLAVADVNAKGGVDGHPLALVIEDNQASATNAVSSFQRMVNQDHVVAVVGVWISEIALSVEPWSARLKTPFIVTGAASNDITAFVHKNYDRNKYVFHAYFPSAFLAQGVCDMAHDVLVGELHMKSAVVISEDAAWTKPLDAGYAGCLPGAGLSVQKEIRFSPDTADFTPIFQQAESLNPDVIVSGWAHVGVQPTVQWADQKVPLPLAGINAQAGSSAFWKATNGGTEGVITTSTSAPNVAITPLTIPFTDAYQKAYGVSPAYSAYSTYDAILALAAAINATHSTKADDIVAGMEKTDLTGTQGRVEFLGRDSQFTHALRFGPGYVTGVAIQWQDGQQKCIWPLNLANAKPEFPGFVKLPKLASAN
jgi:branched-chain amino acid transport system substrate-binding protein